MYPAIHPEVCQTPKGVPYLKSPGAALISMPQLDLSGIRPYLAGFDPKLNFIGYLDDPMGLPPAEALVKVSGQLCYASFGPKRSKNDKAQEYLDHIKSSGHGSVLEHANFSFLFYGISRSLTHELVRHRAGTAFSQLSQRYVSGAVLRFVERPEYQADPELHRLFEERIERAAADYELVAELLLARQKEGSEILSGDARTELRKKVQQCARSVLPNETETAMVMTGNVRAWRHIVEMRANQAAEIEIRQLQMRVYEILVAVAPMLFSDYQVVTLPDGTQAVETKWRKV